jgi:hypothetical protein
MEVRPSARPGVTVFGTRLTYAQAGIGGAVVLIVLVLLITLAVKAFGSDNPPATKPTAAPTAAVKPTAAGTGSMHLGMRIYPHRPSVSLRKWMQIQ